MKKLYQFLRILFFSNFGVFIGRALYAALWYRNHPELYIMNSAPWYTDILVYGVTALGFAVVLGILLWILKPLADRAKE